MVQFAGKIQILDQTPIFVQIFSDIHLKSQTSSILLRIIYLIKAVCPCMCVGNTFLIRLSSEASKPPQGLEFQGARRALKF